MRPTKKGVRDGLSTRVSGLELARVQSPYGRTRVDTRPDAMVDTRPDAMVDTQPDAMVENPPLISFLVGLVLKCCYIATSATSMQRTNISMDEG